MIVFADLPHLILGHSPQSTSLQALVDSPTSRSVVGVFASRVQIEVVSSHEEGLFDLYVCKDAPEHRVPLQSPFAIICLASDAADDPDTFATLYDFLPSRDIHTRPGILLFSGKLRNLATRINLSLLRLVAFDQRDLMDLLLAHPPRTYLTKRLTAHIPHTDLTPYVYQGPVSGKCFLAGKSKWKH